VELISTVAGLSKEVTEDVETGHDDATGKLTGNSLEGAKGNDEDVEIGDIVDIGVSDDAPGIGSEALGSKMDLRLEIFASEMGVLL